MKLLKDEKELLDAYDSGQLKTRTPTAAELKKVKDLAKKTTHKNRRITIRLYEHDYKEMQKKAFEKGLPYQTLISSLIHQYIEGELVPK